MFRKILIANRGEIACRVARTARRLGVRTVAVYSDADAGALHVAMCDEARRLGGAAPRESYLAAERILAVARATGAQAIHPGYGFLSENAAFAQACEDAGIVFIGPPAAAIAAMGSKAAAKRIMGEAGVPLVPGYHGEDQAERVLAESAQDIGYPVLIKATAGGGGKGMRIVGEPGELRAALASARREAASAFGDDRVLIEKYLEAPRHIEVQVFGDTFGNVVHIFERDCSVQRRHQKVLEEAPAPGMTTEHRAHIGRAAVAAAKAIGYVGAGTVEFIAPSSFAQHGTFYFMEMNTRLQVEHAVTEMITGTDLVQWQLEVASGSPLPRTQEALRIHGHAIEARLYAEDPDRGFLPSIGRLTHLRFPRQAHDVRIDTGVREGDEISPHYDPMIAKLIVHGEDRDAALRKLAQALAEVEIAGVATNVAFLRRVLAEGSFARGDLDTNLIARRHDALFPRAAALPDRVLITALLAEIEAIAARARASAAPTDPHSPWTRADAWWLNSSRHALHFEFRAGESSYAASARFEHAAWQIELPEGRRATARVLHREGAEMRVGAAEEEWLATVVTSGDDRTVFCCGDQHRLQLVDRLAHAGEHDAPEGHLRAPMSGTIASVLVTAGADVAKGAPLVVLEAMKMEHTITAPAAGKIAAVHFRAGDRVQEGADLVDLDVAEADATGQ